MSANEEFQRLASHHDDEAKFAIECRLKFETGEVFSLGGGYALDHDDWSKEMIATYTRLEQEHIAIRDSFLKKLQP